MALKQYRILWILGAVVILLLVFAIVGKRKGWIGGGKAEKVTVEKAGRRLIVEKVFASGKIYPEIEVKISPDVSGEVIELAVAEGDSVNKGDLLVRIKPDVYQSMVEQAEAAVNQARANFYNAKARLAEARAQFQHTEQSYNRNKRLYDEGVISLSEYEAALANYKAMEATVDAARQTVLGAQYSVNSAQASLKEAMDNLGKTTISAPMDGIVSSLSVERGERVVGTSQMPGTELLRIANFINMEVRVNVSENDIIRVGLGDTAFIEVDAYPDRASFQGVVRQIANSAMGADLLTTDQVTNFEVNIRLLRNSYDDLLAREDIKFPFRPGMSASVVIETDKVYNALSVPIQAVTIREVGEKAQKNNSQETDSSEADSTRQRQETEEVVFKFKNGSAELAVVNTGIQSDAYIQMLKGVQEGEEVITGPYRLVSRTLENGDVVEKVTREELYEAVGEE